MMGIMESNILSIYKIYHAGREKAITRDDFLREYWEDLPDITDRKFRNIYSQLPICTCDNGGFYPIRKEEIEEFRIYLRKKAIPLFERFRQVCDAYPKLTRDMGQLELFVKEEIT